MQGGYFRMCCILPIKGRDCNALTVPLYKKYLWDALQDAVRAVTKTAIREARIKEVRREMLNSEKLKTYFEENPKDLQVLRHDAISRPLKVKKHMKNVPEYLSKSQSKKHNASFF